MIIELRSDTFTLPTPGMKEAMIPAKVGDDVFGEDPSINELEAMTAEMFGMEAAIFCPSGTMTNQIGINVHTRPGDEVICDELSHVYIYEGGGIAFNSGSQVKTLKGDRSRLTAQMVEDAINPDDIHKARTRVVSIENTTNRGGGACYPMHDLKEIKKVCERYGLAYHLDGARLWNALVAKGENAAEYGQLFDTISVCLSKGLGAPVGSLLVGSAAHIREARRVRKKLGGGMRQAGFMAAAGIYALQHHIDRLQTDHLHAAKVADALRKRPWVSEILEPETNILIFGVQGRFSPASFCAYMEQHHIRCMAISPTRVRLVFHLDVSPEMVMTLIQVIDQMPQ
ncbi:MAG TPA: GntG family PLP-dependent aldolase [Phnomibacter sp.]|nr:GntG family PLP-dependent aldolase [Phnomibacter sp.]